MSQAQNMSCHSRYYPAFHHFISCFFFLSNYLRFIFHSRYYTTQYVLLKCCLQTLHKIIVPMKFSNKIVLFNIFQRVRGRAEQISNYCYIYISNKYKLKYSRKAGMETKRAGKTIDFPGRNVVPVLSWWYLTNYIST